MITPRLQQWAASPAASLINLMVTGVAAIGVPLVGYVGSRTIDELVSLNKAIHTIHTTSATVEQRTRALETLTAAHAEAIATQREKLGELRERTLRHEFLLELLERSSRANSSKKEYHR